MEFLLVAIEPFQEVVGSGSYTAFEVRKRNGSYTRLFAILFRAAGVPPLALLLPAYHMSRPFYRGNCTLLIGIPVLDF
jgi:hypothetical protein